MVIAEGGLREIVGRYHSKYAAFRRRTNACTIHIARLPVLRCTEEEDEAPEECILHGPSGRLPTDVFPVDDGAPERRGGTAQVLGERGEVVTGGETPGPRTPLLALAYSRLFRSAWNETPSFGVSVLLVVLAISVWPSVASTGPAPKPVNLYLAIV